MLLFAQLQSGIESGRKIESDLKQAFGSKVQVRTKDKLRAAANDHMTMLESIQCASRLTFKTHAYNMPIEAI